MVDKRDTVGSGPDVLGWVNQSNTSSGGDVTQDTQRHRTLRRHNETQRETTSVESASTRTSTPGRDASPEEVDSGVAVSSDRSYRQRKSDLYEQVLSLPLNDSLGQIWQWWKSKQDGHDFEEPWRSELFDFAWLVRGHRELREFLPKPAKAADVVEQHLRGWTQARLSRGEDPPFGNDGDPWDAWFGVPRRDARAEFVDVWKKARYMPGESPLRQAFDQATRHRLLLTDQMREEMDADPSDMRSEDDFEYFVSVAGHLQVIVGNRPIKLPCQVVGDMMGVSKMTISRWRKAAVGYGLMVVTKEHQFRSRGQGDATEFRFETRWYKVLEERVEKPKRSTR